MTSAPIGKMEKQEGTPRNIAFKNTSAQQGSMGLDLGLETFPSTRMLNLAVPISQMLLNTHETGDWPPRPAANPRVILLAGRNQLTSAGHWRPPHVHLPNLTDWQNPAVSGILSATESGK